ncbi:hypothetical protein Cni_G12283 [Canna indica]|uniref:Uncharacterized protein n=1 Tax=Canna indica TaxID=4628 RepID=A0AAQ3KAD3_9LILI|nr:hypothetical protein Cni_G12283 [Canna indica]
MWPPPSNYKEDLDAGSVPYCRQLPRRSRHAHSNASANSVAAGHQPSPFRPSSYPSAIPFSWERRPGIPKTPGPFAPRSTGGAVLPLPPPLRSAPAAASHHKKRPAASPAANEDPFAVALAECAKCPPGPSIEELFSRSGSALGPRRRRATAISDRLGLFGLHAASCKANCAVADSAVHVPRAGSRSGGSYGSLNRRSI